jgi:hypothetical protein
MKKKILGGIAISAIAAVAAFNMNLGLKKNDLSAISLANMEALADGESPKETKTCWKTLSSSSENAISAENILWGL